jgi:dTDP-4-amino-4,6-dideoxygalactose transaminase
MQTLSLFNVVNTPEMETVAIEVMRSGRIASGTYVPAFEDGLSKLLGQQNIVTTVDMTSAIYLALHLAGVKAGDDVLTTAFACMSTNSPIATIGARPIWVDMAANSAFISVADFEAAITPKTKAAILYHLAGYPGPIQEIAAICKKYGIALIEDCDNALLAKVDGKNVGVFGDYAVYSFYPNRQINTTEGGALICKKPSDALLAKKLRRFGIDGSSFRTRSGEISPAADIPEAGWSMTLNNLCSALGLAQLQTVNDLVEKTRKNALFLIEKLTVLIGVNILQAMPNSQPVYWALLIQVENRDSVLEQLKLQGVMASQLHQRNDIYSCFTNSERNLPNTTELQNTIIALPCGWWLGASDLAKIVDVIKNALENVSGASYKMAE